MTRTARQVALSLIFCAATALVLACATPEPGGEGTAAEPSVAVIVQGVDAESAAVAVRKAIRTRTTAPTTS